MGGIKMVTTDNLTQNQQITKHRQEILEDVVSENFVGLTDFLLASEDNDKLSLSKLEYFRELVNKWNEQKNQPKVQKLPFIKRDGWWDRRY